MYQCVIIAVVGEKELAMVVLCWSSRRDGHGWVQDYKDERSQTGKERLKKKAMQMRSTWYIDYCGCRDCLMLFELEW